MTLTPSEVFMIVVIVLILLTQSTLLFIDAKKKQGFAWFWGIWGLIQFPLPTLFYYLFVILPYKKKKNEMGR